jgi:Ca2+-binding EF-hand superfamily protein
MIPMRPSAKIAALLAIAALAGCSPASSKAAPEGVTLDRFLERQTGRIMAADTDGDGRVSRAEAAAMMTDASRRRATNAGRDPSRMFDAMDSNHDGYLDKAEIAAVLTKRFHRMDRNGDGILTSDERMAAHPERGQGAPTDAAAKSQP